MLDVILRGLSLILGLGLILAGVWGPSWAIEVLLAGIALILSGVLSPNALQKTVPMLVLLLGFTCLLVRLVGVIARTVDPYEMVVQAVILIIGTCLLGYVGVKQGRNWLHKHGLI
jgi:hypothetical protein